MGSAIFASIPQAVVSADAATWKTAFMTFVVGFSTVFVCLAILMSSLYLSGYVIRTLENRQHKDASGGESISPKRAGGTGGT